MLIFLRPGPRDGTFVVVAADGRSILVSTEWDYAPLARAFGWNGRYAKRKHGTLGEAAAAHNWLDSRKGASAEDPGYFAPEPHGNLTVDLAANARRRGPRVPSRSAHVASVAEASAVVRQYVNQYGLDQADWAGGTIRRGEGPVARVSYDGRVWDLHGGPKAIYDPFGGKTEGTSQGKPPPSEARRTMRATCGCKR
jgi:hypothetical protein